MMMPSSVAVDYYSGFSTAYLTAESNYKRSHQKAILIVKRILDSHSLDLSQYKSSNVDLKNSKIKIFLEKNKNSYVLEHKLTSDEINIFEEYEIDKKKFVDLTTCVIL